MNSDMVSCGEAYKCLHVPPANPANRGRSVFGLFGYHLACTIQWARCAFKSYVGYLPPFGPLGKKWAWAGQILVTGRICLWVLAHLTGCGCGSCEPDSMGDTSDGTCLHSLGTSLLPSTRKVHRKHGKAPRMATTELVSADCPGPCSEPTLSDMASRHLPWIIFFQSQLLVA